MAWTAVTDTPQIKTMYEAPGTYFTADIDTSGYDYILFWSSGQVLKAMGKVDNDADGVADEYRHIFAEEAGVYKKSGNDSEMGHLNLLPQTLRLQVGTGTGDVANVWVELRRHATWDRGRG